MIRSLLFLHARRGRGAELLGILEQLGVLAMAGEQPGFLGVEIAVTTDDEDEVLIIGSWASREHYERWRAGPAREQAIRRIEDLLTSPPVNLVYRIVEAVG